MASAESVSPKVAAYIEKIEARSMALRKGVMEQKESLIEGASAVTGALVGSYVRERYADKKIMGADHDAVAAALFGVAAVFSKGTTQMVLSGLATGCLCSVVAQVGAQKGAAAKLAAASAK